MLLVVAMQLDAEILTDRFRKLSSPELLAKAKAMAEVLKKEDGVKGAVNTFYRQWHVDQTWRRVPETVAAELQAEKLKESQEQKAAAAAPKNPTTNRPVGGVKGTAGEKQKQKTSGPVPASLLHSRRPSSAQSPGTDKGAASKPPSSSKSANKVVTTLERDARTSPLTSLLNRPRMSTVTSTAPTTAANTGVAEAGRRKSSVGRGRDGSTGSEGTKSDKGTNVGATESDTSESSSRNSSHRSSMSDLLPSLGIIPDMPILPDMPSSSDMIPDITSLSFFSSNEPKPETAGKPELDGADKDTDKVAFSSPLPTTSDHRGRSSSTSSTTSRSGNKAAKTGGRVKASTPPVPRTPRRGSSSNSSKDIDNAVDTTPRRGKDRGRASLVSKRPSSSSSNPSSVRSSGGDKDKEKGDGDENDKDSQAEMFFYGGSPLQWLIEAQEDRPTTVSIMRSLE